MDLFGQLNVQRMFPPGTVQGAGWEGDQGLTMPYLRGRQLEIPAGTTQQIGGSVDLKEIRRLRVTLGCVVPQNTPIPVGTPNFALRFILLPSVESDQIPRVITVPAGNSLTPETTGGQACFVTCRSLNITVINPSSVALLANYSIDEQFTAAPMDWTTSLPFNLAVGVSQLLNLPPFCKSIVILSATGGANVVITGSDFAGIPVYSEIFPAPRAGPIPVSPGLQYRIQTAGGVAQIVNVLYLCSG